MKKLNLFNKILIILSSIINTICLVLTLMGKYDANVLGCLSYYLLMIVPFVLKKLKVEFSDPIKTVYIVFMICACLVGSILKFYGRIYWFDSFVHYISGILTAFLGFIVLIRFKKYNEKNIAFNIVFMILLTLSVAALWECFEFTVDMTLGGDTQKVMTTGVTDTMKDIICALFGGLLSSIMYAYEFVNKKKWLVYNIIKSIK